MISLLRQEIETGMALVVTLFSDRCASTEAGNHQNCPQASNSKKEHYKNTGLALLEPMRHHVEK